jgi:hypothetical protein
MLWRVVWTSAGCLPITESIRYPPTYFITNREKEYKVTYSSQILSKIKKELSQYKCTFKHFLCIAELNLVS